MIRLKISLVLILVLSFSVLPAQVSIRLFADKLPESAVFSVSEGRYEVDFFNGEKAIVNKGKPVILTRYEDRLAVKADGSEAFICDSVMISGKTGNDLFSLRLNGGTSVRRFYSGDLKCFPDLGTLVLVNICDVEKYIAGVVRAEGGTGWNLEYFKTQAVIARTYMYKYLFKHLPDRYNLCDNTHCQAFSGITSDSVINRATLETKGQVILASDSTLIISAFHSNCGGETSSSGDVWLSEQPYLKSVRDPYCGSSRNARWEKSFPRDEWLAYLRQNGYKGNPDDQLQYGFVQLSRQTDFRAGTFSIPLRTMRTDLKLRSTFFSVAISGESVILKGRGYGHGVGLCQEGAMAMAAKGFNYRQIIDFYYTGIFVANIKDAVLIPEDDALPVNNSQEIEGDNHSPGSR
jgi:stage II sporulation protein D